MWVQDNSPQDILPHKKLAPRQLAAASEDNTPQVMRYSRHIEDNSD